MKLPDEERAWSYITKMPPSVQGSGGSTALYRVAVALVKGFSLGERVAEGLLADWNAQHAVPPWNERELAHKLRSATASKRADGYLLTDRRGDAGRGKIVFPEADPGAAERVKKRAQWPSMRPASEACVYRVAALRGLAPLPVDCVRANGFLWEAEVDGHACYVLREGTVAQARRLDGGSFLLEGREVKAKSLPGSEGHFLGWKLLGGPENPVLLVEGAVALLEGVAAAFAVDADARLENAWTVLAAMSSASRPDSSLRQQLAGRRVRIVPDADAAGMEALARWTEALRPTGARVDAFRLPEGMRDLGPLVSDPERYRGHLEELFTL